MRNIWGFIAMLILLAGICASADSEYESGTGEDLHPKKREIATTASPDSEQSSSSTVSAKDKPDASPTSSAKPILLLSDIIDHVEGALVQSALIVVKYVKGTQNATDVEKIPIETPDKSKRSLAPEEVNSEKDAIFKFVTSRSIPATEDGPARFVVAKVAVSEVKPGLGSLISSLDFHVQPSAATVATTPGSAKDASGAAGQGKLMASSTHTTVPATAAHTSQSADVKVEEVKDSSKVLTVGKSNSPIAAEKDSTSALTASTTAIPTTTNSSSAATSSAATSASSNTNSDASVSPSTVKSTTETTKAATMPASTSTATATTTTTTTTKNPIEKLKEAEDDVKEKVTEIEAEPIIFSARV